MELFFFMLFLFIVFGVMGGDKRKAKAKSRLQNSQGGQGSSATDDFPSDWSRYEANERGEGMQEDLDPSKLYEVSKARIEAAQQTARNVAASRLSYTGLPKISPKKLLNDNVQRFETTAKNKKAKARDPFAMDQPPLIRDMNLARRLFLSGGRNNTFGEREKKSNGKTLLGFVVLGVLAFYLAHAIGG